MENNNVVAKKNNGMVIIIVLIILAVIAVIAFKNKDKLMSPKEKPITQTEVDLNNAVASDDTKSITDSINNIKIDDTSASDLKTVDQELGNL